MSTSPLAALTAAVIWGRCGGGGGGVCDAGSCNFMGCLPLCLSLRSRLAMPPAPCSSTTTAYSRVAICASSLRFRPLAKAGRTVLLPERLPPANKALLRSPHLYFLTIAAPESRLQYCMRAAHLFEFKR